MTVTANSILPRQEAFPVDAPTPQRSPRRWIQAKRDAFYGVRGLLAGGCRREGRGSVLASAGGAGGGRRTGNLWLVGPLVRQDIQRGRDDDCVVSVQPHQLLRAAGGEMASVAKGAWDTELTARLNELEQIHAAARGRKRGRRWYTEQLNRSLFVTLVGQFQAYCKALHDESVVVHLAHANPQQAPVLRRLMTVGLRLDRQNPRCSALGDDFARVGIDLISAIKSKSRRAASDLDSLDLLVDFRNAVAHGNEGTIAILVADGRIRPTLTWYRRYRKTIERLVTAMDDAVADSLAGVLAIPRPW